MDVARVIDVAGEGSGDLDVFRAWSLCDDSSLEYRVSADNSRYRARE
jgi:hypothetical protein